MATKLEETTQSAKKVFIGCGIFVLVVLLYSTLSKLLERDPVPYYPFPTEAEEKFKQLPSPSLESLQLAEGSEVSYKIDTLDGTLPEFPEFLNVYKTQTPRQSLTASDDVKEIAKALYFTDEPTPTSASEVVWTLGPRTLTIDKLYKTVHLTTNYREDSSVRKPQPVSVDTEAYISKAQNYLQKAQLLPEEYMQGGKQIVTLLRLNNDFEMKKASAASEANFVRVDFFKEVELLSVIIPPGVTKEQEEYLLEQRLFSFLLRDNPYQGMISIIFGGAAGLHDIYEIHYAQWPISDQTTYNAVPVSQAWEQVQQNNGYLRYVAELDADPYQAYAPLSITTFLLTNVEIIYYTTPTYIQYIQPLYKFSGIAKTIDNTNAEFIIYYPAVKSE